LLENRGIPGVKSSFCEELFIRLDRTFFPAENRSVGCFDIAKEVQNLSHRFHPAISHFAVQWGKLGGIALNNEHPAANGAHRSTNNLHTTTSKIQWHWNNLVIYIYGAFQYLKIA
jgi:hypothetical protein